MKQIINLGSGVGTHDGDGARTGGEKINENFTEVYDTIDLLIADSTIYNHITKSTGFSLAGQNLTVNAGWEWLVGNIEKTNAANVVVNIPYSASGKSRVEYLVPNASNGFTRVIGIESTSSPVAPLLPNKDMFVTWYIVDDGSIGELSPTITGENFIAKNEKIRLDNINGTGSLADWTIGNERSCFNFSNTVTEFKSFHYASQIYAYDGKIFTFKNSQAGAVTLFHNAGTGLFKFRFPNAANFVLHQYEVVEFRLNYEDTSVPKLEYIGVIASTAFSGTQDDVPDGSVYKQYSATEKTKLAAITGTNTGDETASSIVTKIGDGTKINQSYLPSYVDDVLEYANLAAFPGTGEAGKIYVAIDSSKQYRWTGSAYLQITNGLIATTADVPEGSNLYFTTARVLATLLTGISFATGGAIVSTDSVLVAFGKIQKQITDALTAIGLKQDTLTDANFGTFENGLTAKATPIDADLISIIDTADSNKAKKTTFTQLKAFLKTYLDTLYQPKGVRVTNATTTGSYPLDWNAADVWQLTLTGATTITDTNLPTGTATKVIELMVKGSFAITLPSYWEATPSSGTYTGAKWNHFVISCIVGTTSSEKVIYSNEVLAT